MKKILPLFLVFIIGSCNLFQGRGIAFKIENTSDAPITLVTIATSEKLDGVTFDTIPRDENREGFLSMKDNKTDGSYTLEYTHQDGTKKVTSGGYYTNGSPMDSWIRFEIQNDTTLIKFGEFPK